MPPALSLEYRVSLFKQLRDLQPLRAVLFTEMAGNTFIGLSLSRGKPL